MNRIYYRLLKLVNPGKRWYSHKPLQISTQRGHFAEPPEMVASSSQTAICENCELCTDRSPGVFFFSHSFFGFFLLQKCSDRSRTVNEILKCTKLYSIKLELLDSMKSCVALLVFLVSE